MSVTEIFEDRKQNSVVTIVVGVVLLVAGIAALIWPDITLSTLAAFFGVAVLFVGVVTLVAGIRDTGAGSRASDVVLGVVGIGLGVLALRQPGGTLLFLVYATGIWLIVAGIVDAAAGLSFDGPGRGWQIAGGVVDVIAGILILAVPDIGITSLALFVGIALTFRGIMLVGAGITGYRSVA